MNPYKNSENRQFWSRAVSWEAWGRVDPVSKSFLIDPNSPVATMGSCFAQHISRQIAKSGCNYFVPESAPIEMDDAEAKQHSYGVFSARYGNVYTVRQALQLFREAFGVFSPSLKYWRSGDGVIDPYRPNIQPQPFSDVAELTKSREIHLHCVRKIFSSSAVFVFTLGLTEGWQFRQDCAAIPLAPGTIGDPCALEDYKFVNYGFNEIRSDLFELLSEIAKINPDCKFILTVSPVPLIATYEKQHVVTANTYSKSLLRVAAQEADNFIRNVVYFPSYEIITCTASQGAYFENDFRQVNSLGVNHVMRIFKSNFILEKKQKNTEEPTPFAASRTTEELSVVCDEETIERSLRALD
jgi:hypothetical protein